MVDRGRRRRYQRPLGDAEREISESASTPTPRSRSPPATVLGVATVMLDDLRALRPADVEVAAAIARSAALAVENAHLLKQSAGGERERNRLAREHTIPSRTPSSACR
jgi:GAF domain-containing protein